MDITQNEYTEGDVAVCRADFTDSNGSLQDPGAVSFIYEPPNETPVQYNYPADAQVVRMSQGVYTVDLDTTGKPGTWYYRFFSTGTGKTAKQDQFHVVTARPQA